MSKTAPVWAAPGDVNAFFGLMLDNIADLVLTVSLLNLVFGFPVEFALRHMVPGTAIGVLVGDLLFFALALRTAASTGRDDVTAMPLGLDTPSTFGMVFFVLGPAFSGAVAQGMTPDQAAEYTWHIGIWSIVLSGLFKAVCALGSGWIRSVVPRAGLLGSLAAIALVLISFIPLVEIFHLPLVGLVALAIILTTLVARIELPWKIPGALGALLVAGAIYYLMAGVQFGFQRADIDLELGIELSQPFNPWDGMFPYEWTEVFLFRWVSRFGDAVQYLPIVIPFALGTVIGGIDCTESAAAAGDEYDTNQVIGVEAFATLVAGLCGGVIQTTPYIGHPAYKAMGGRSAYTLATALFVGAAGLIGFFGYLYLLIPKPAVFPILVFIGLEITAQSFHATPKKHYPAVALACVPALAALVMVFLPDMQSQYIGPTMQIDAAIERLEAQEDQLDDSGKEAVATLRQQQRTLEELAGKPPGKIGEPAGKLGKDMQTMRMLSAGFILTSLIWASTLAAIIDRRLGLAAIWLAVAGGCALFGVIHSPLPGSPLTLPWALPEHLPHNAVGQTPLFMAGAYLLAAALLGLWNAIAPPPVEEPAADASS